MANSVLTSSIITNEALRVLENNLTFAANVTRDYDDKFAKEGAKVGDTINIRKPARYVGRIGAAMSIEDHTETSVPLQLDTQAGVDLSFTTKDLTLSLDEFSDRIIKPAMANIGNRIDRDGLLMAYQATANAVGTPGTVPTTLRTYLQAGAKLDDTATPRDGDRSIVMGPWAQLELIDALKGLFQSGPEIANQYKTGNMGQVGGFKFSMDQNVVSHTVGPLGGTPAVNGAAQVGSTLVTNGWTAAAAARLNKGDVFTIAGVFGVNPQSRQSTGQLAQFVVTAAVSSDASGNASIPIFPAIVTSGAFQTVTASPANAALLTVLGAANVVTPAHLAYHKNAFVLGSADLMLPEGVHKAARASSKQTGLSVRMIQQYSISNDTMPCRFDVLYGWRPLYAELACRIQG